MSKYSCTFKYEYKSQYLKVLVPVPVNYNSTTVPSLANATTCVRM